MPHVLERAPTGRAKCRACGKSIAAGEIRLGERLPNPFADGDAEMTHWFHPICAAFKRPEPLLAMIDEGADVSALERRDFLEHEARLGLTHRRLPRVDAVSRAPSARATCRACREKIEKGNWRIALVYYEDGRFAPSGFAHLRCARTYFETTALLPRIQHWSPHLAENDFAEIGRGLSGV